MHEFHKNQSLEKKYAYLHDFAYQQVFKTTSRELEIQLVGIDREKCNYETTEGKVFQQGDTDSILEITATSPDGVKKLSKKVSEKIRSTIYDDLYVEIISVLKEDGDNYTVEDLGWANKDVCNPALAQTPDYLSYICLDQKNDRYKGLFLSNYKTLKKELFYGEKALLKDIVNPDFVKQLNNKINEVKKESSWKTSFSMRVYNQFYNNIVFAKNKSKTGQGNYYTIGVTLSLEKLKKLGIRLIKVGGSLQPVAQIAPESPLKKKM